MIFVTGGTGFVGQRFIARQLAAGQKIRALIRAGKKPPLLHPQLEWVVGDMADRDSLAQAMNGIETVVHLAAILANPDEAVNEAINAEGTRTLIQLCRINGTGRFILMSAAAVKFKQSNAYGRSKKRAEEITISSGLDYAILRAPLIIGPGSEEWSRFVDYICKIPAIIPVFGDGQAVKCPVYIDDILDALDALLARPQLGSRIWEVACREAITLDGLIDATCARLGVRKYKLHIPLQVSLWLAGFAEMLLGGRAPVTRDIIRGINEDVHFDIQPALQELRIDPRSVAESIALSLEPRRP
jgi:nucleoside-diphosphate-sugar epimerase